MVQIVNDLSYDYGGLQPCLKLTEQHFEKICFFSHKLKTMAQISCCTTRADLPSFVFHYLDSRISEPREKIGLRGFRPGPTLTGLYNRIRWLEA